MVLIFSNRRQRDFETWAKQQARIHWPRVPITFCDLGRTIKSALQTKGVTGVVLPAQQEDMADFYRRAEIKVIVAGDMPPLSAKAATPIALQLGRPLLEEILALPLPKFGNICKCMVNQEALQVLRVVGVEVAAPEFYLALLTQRLLELKKGTPTG